MPTVTLTRSTAENGQLPAVCVRCGEPAVRQVHRMFSYNAEGELPLDVVAIFTLAHDFTKVRIALPVCERHTEVRTWQTTNAGWNLVAYLAFIVFILCVLHDLELRNRPIILSDWQKYLLLAVITLAWWMGFRRWRARSLEVVGLSESSVTLAGVSQHFAEACQSASRE